jgi:hypothetical protein
MSGPVSVELSGDEALVLEKSLAEPFAKDYAELVQQARGRILAG